MTGGRHGWRADEVTLARPRVAVVNDYEVVVAGLAAMLEPFADQVELVGSFKIDEPIDAPVDVALYDTFGNQGIELVGLATLLGRPEVRKVAVYSFDFDLGSVREAVKAGASGYLSKATPAAKLVAQLVKVAEGKRVISGPSGGGRNPKDERGRPGRDLGLSEREAEVVGLAALGRRNAEIADILCVSVDTVKTHLARSFRKLGVHNRTELAALVYRRPRFRTSPTPGARRPRR